MTAHRLKGPPVNALDAWLDSQRMTNARFAARLSKRTGLSLVDVYVQRWRKGARVPHRLLWRHIATLTKGAVPVETWQQQRPAAECADRAS